MIRWYNLYINPLIKKRKSDYKLGLLKFTHLYKNEKRTLIEVVYNFAWNYIIAIFNDDDTYYIEIEIIYVLVNETVIEKRNTISPSIFWDKTRFWQAFLFYT